MLQQTARQIEVTEEVATPKPKARRTWSEDAITHTGYIGEALKVFLCDGDPDRIKSANPYKVLMRGFSKELWFVRKSQWTKSGWNKSLLAKEINGAVFGNSSVIFGGKRAEIENRRQRKAMDGFGRGGELECQRVVNQYIPMIPFVLFKESKLDVSKLTLIDKGEEKQIDFGRTTKEGKKILTHFTGAILFSIDDTYFMADLDQNEIEHRKMNFWMSKLPRKAASIADAYASLKPKEVSDAERFLGRTCARQGEWFFIPVQGEYKKSDDVKTEVVGWSTNRKTVAILQSKGNRPHYVSDMSKEGFVKGEVTHGGYEHHPIMLKGWHKPVPNTAVESFKISGMVD